MKYPIIFKNLSEENKKKLHKKTQPLFVKPMLATLTNDYFSSDNWIYEHKFDGERCLTIKKKGKVHLVSRNKKSMNREYPELVEAFEKQNADNFIIDGEIVARGKSGVSDFQLLQSRINLQEADIIKRREANIHIVYCIFDIMYVEGYDTCSVPLLARKKILKKLLKFNSILSYTTHKTGDGIAYFKKACKMHWEGLIAKYGKSEYVGKRSPDWLKFKCIFKQELVIGGYTKPKGSRIDFGALLVGYYKGKKFTYAGKVGTGYSQETLKLLGNKMKKLHTKKCPFSNYDETTKDIQWIKPKLVAEFEFAQWTRGGRLRVGRYKGLRDDKSAKDVVKETPKAIGPRRK
ncbi:MAG TPA: non-homologous end-joining DNA ligase [Candidatus Babeliales bacterium]|nr:non-homologous end-joining DNA ligase [Candidatus Babeliales bacterium]